ncbi:MAG: hypothetical protein LBG52_00430 [Candidatus Peribacteria bacterium]|nr:hypothetical protein [Candidatus Peribacteria bacterium]
MYSIDLTTHFRLYLFFFQLQVSTVQEKNIDYNHLSPSREPNVALTVGTMACLVLTAKPLKMGKNSKFNNGWEPLERA